ncbi:damage-control phosphatase ARMT1-like [Adelges cooleyi]|uniref:damage-control phosphatase ARMT1-like n=1 Tax=Adelges cooleyi TaxID=133065 RepID=UPI0021803C8B|nr:damage-control phosphatase ARMT1-like [Adelges cooleyi]XP_050431856.1 damage-control phosphatase ARMT1-like [Adelges cooleyi]XP_050431857.1 damage-control phosphatase ARMT1-like [Adelges cooleyi]XP_050431859.1 damage-control phosphatase ARMT1-like [Adelges cooleyi]
MSLNNEQFINQSTPINLPLRGKYKKSFGYVSMCERMPKLFTQIINYLKIQPLESNEQQEMENVIEEIKLLVDEIISNKPLRKINATFKLALVWNQILDEKLASDSIVSWFDSEWLFTENYMYIRIKEAFAKTSSLQNYDPFECLKSNAYNESELSMISLAEFILLKLSNKELDTDGIYILFKQILKISLWGNRCDLSLSAGKSMAVSEDPSKAIVSLDKYLLADHSNDIWNLMQQISCQKPKKIDIIMDNSAYELFTDLCLADFLLTFELADVIVFHGKSIPWYVSDVTKLDFEGILDHLENKSTHSALKKLGKKWSEYYKNGKFILKCEDFWTLPYPYSKIALKDYDLYTNLADSQLLIFKGDLNYRKLIGDINWIPTTDFKQALCGFLPTAVVALRTLKCDCISGLPLDYETKIEQVDENNWLTTGKYGVIQCAK